MGYGDVCLSDSRHSCLTARLLSGERTRASKLGLLEMASLSTPALDIVPSRTASSFLQIIPDFLALTKPEVNFLIVIATFTGFYLGYPGDLHNFPLGRLLNTLFGTLLVASGTGTLNQYLEHRLRCADAADTPTPDCRRQAAARERPRGSACRFPPSALFTSSSQ